MSAPTTATTEAKGPTAGQPGYQITRDPALVKNRIYVANLPVCNSKQLESICVPYGKILGTIVLHNKLNNKSYGFVQFESEEIANKVASAIHNSTFKGQNITACNASVKKPAKLKRPNVMQMDQQMSVPMGSAEGGDYNDCEIIVLDRNNTQYAEFIEQRLKRLGLRVDLLFPNAEVPLGKVLSNISSRRCLYAVLVTSQHEELNSITVNILYGVPAEHRNMPVEDAIALIANDFRRKMAEDGIAHPAPMRASIPAPVAHSHSYQPMPVVPTNIKDRHPENIQTLINLLADNVRLTVLQFNCLIKYLQELREDQMKVELGNAAVSERARTPDPEFELQKRILNILNKPSVAENKYPLMYPTLDAVKQDDALMNLLKDERIQRAIDSLMDSNLVSTVENYMKF